MLPRYENTNIPHVSISTAILNTINSTNIKTNAYHPSKDALALDSSELIEQAKDIFGELAINNLTFMLKTPTVTNYLNNLTVNQKAVYIKDMLIACIEANYPQPTERRVA